MKATLNEEISCDGVLSTVFAEGDYSGNSRPLTDISVDSQELEVIL